jgi:acyl carrier protein phosphodiesterase
MKSMHSYSCETKMVSGMTIDLYLSHLMERKWGSGVTIDFDLLSLVSGTGQ